MDVKKKLVELIEKGCMCPDDANPFICDTDCRYKDSPCCGNERLADHLIANGVTVQEWIPVTERLPEPKENPVLVVYGGCVWAAWKHDNYWELVPGLNTTCVTHWTPLPEPPKGE